MLAKQSLGHWLVWGLAGAAAGAVIFYVLLDLVYANKVLPGVWLGDTELSGEPLDQLTAVTLPLFKTAQQNSLVFKSNDWTKTYTNKSLGINYFPAETITGITNFGRGKNILVNFSQRLQAAIAGKQLPASYQDQLNKLDQAIAKISKEVNQAGVDGEVVIVAKQATIKPAVTGIMLDTTELNRVIRQQLVAIDFSPIDLPVQTTLPKFTSEIAQATADQINQSLGLAYTLKTRAEEIELTTDQLWVWVEVVKQPEAFLVRLRPADLQQYLQTLKESMDQPVVNASLTIKQDRVTEFVPDQLGVILDIAPAAELIQRNLLTEQHQIDLPARYVEPRTTLGETNDLGIKELVARGESNFAGSPKNRRHNIKVGASKFNHVLVKPDEKFSFNRLLGIVDASTGYLPELVIKGDATTPEFGGGLCQVSTTVFRAALHGGYPIVARQNHSYRVSYYEPAGTDATVYQPYPDFQFKNDTPYYILIRTYVDGDNLFFDFYSSSTGIKVEIEGPRIYNITEPPSPVYIETSTLPAGVQKKIDTAHRGADTIAYRHIFDDTGKEIRKDIFKSHYIPWPAKYLVGVVAAPKVETNLGNVPPEATSQESNPTSPPNNPT